MALAPLAPDPVAAALDDLRGSAFVAGRLQHETILPASPGRLVAWPAAVHPELLRALTELGRGQAYSHQGVAVEAALAGRDVTVVTPTASGKSLCYSVPVLDAWLRDGGSRSLWLFPTKALAQDQVAALAEITKLLPDGFSAAAYDGDTPSGVRRFVRESGNVVITNPDMLHSGILPHHTRWVRLFQSLRYVVIDELHAYRGLFGSHLANVLRRLFRLCRFYGCSPTVISCSATIANPGELAERLFERPVECITESGAPRPERRLWLWNPPGVAGAPGMRRSAVLEARRLVAELVRRDLQTIAFARSRSSVEVLLSYLRAIFPAAPGEHRKAPVRGYRSGYLPLERRAIEAGLREGDVRAVVSTNALELGIDIGRLDAAVLVGFPGSIASLWQQLGRAGRRETTALGVFVAGDSPLDQFLVKHPDYLLGTPPEEALVSPDNLLVLGSHLQAAAFELAFDRDEGFGRAEGVPELLECLADDGVLHRSAERYHWSSDAFPAEAIHLRRACATNVLIIDTSTSPAGPGQGPQGPWAGTGGGRPGTSARVIGEVDQFSAPVLVHDDAIYLHQGEQFHVERLDWEEKRAYVHPVGVDHYTVAETRQQLAVLERYREVARNGVSRSVGEVRISRLATIYKKVRFHTHENVGAGPINLPEQDLHTTAVWLTFLRRGPGAVSRTRIGAGLHGCARALHAAACLLCMCDPRDLGTHVELRVQPVPEPPVFGGDRTPTTLGQASVGEVVDSVQSTPPDPPRQSAGDLGSAVYLYDTVAGGIGFAERCHERLDSLLSTALGVVTGCGCDSGCPSCVGPGAETDGKAATLDLLAMAIPGTPGPVPSRPGDLLR